MCKCTCSCRGILCPIHNLNFRKFLNNNWHLWGLISSKKNCDQTRVGCMYLAKWRTQRRVRYCRKWCGTICCLYISLPFQPRYLPVCVLTLWRVFACCGQDTVVQANIIADGAPKASYLWLPYSWSRSHCIMDIQWSLCMPPARAWPQIFLST